MDLRRISILLATGWLWSCHSPASGPDATVPGTCVTEAPLLPAQKTDLLFVIDNSGSMAEEQAGIANELPAFLEELQKGAGVAQDFQVGVITTAVYQHAEVSGQVTLADYPAQSGKLQAVPVDNGSGTLVPGNERVLHGGDPQLLPKFRALIQQGTSGSGQETPFEAVRLAVAQNPLPAENAGFLRDGARLIVVTVTDEDDCSETERPPEVKVGNQTSRDYCAEQASRLTSVDTYFDLFTNLKDSTGATRPVVWATIGPVSRTDKTAQAILENGVLRNVDCPTSVAPGTRHAEMAAKFDPSLTNLDSICRENYRQALLTIAALANQRQDLVVSGVPDPRLLKVEITRGDGNVQLCTELNEGIRYQEGVVYFQNECLRRGDAKALEVKLLCVS